MQQNQNYLKNIGAFPAKINKIITKNAQGQSKACYYVEFITDTGKIVSQRLAQPFGKADYFKAMRLIALFAPTVDTAKLEQIGEQGTVTNLNKIVGKELVILVKAEDWQGKEFFNVCEVLPRTTAQYIERKGASNDAIGNLADTASDLLGPQTSHASDDLGL